MPVGPLDNFNFTSNVASCLIDNIIPFETLSYFESRSTQENKMKNDKMVLTHPGDLLQIHGCGLPHRHASERPASYLSKEPFAGQVEDSSRKGAL